MAAFHLQTTLLLLILCVVYTVNALTTRETPARIRQGRSNAHRSTRLPTYHLHSRSRASRARPFGIGFLPASNDSNGEKQKEVVKKKRARKKSVAAMTQEEKEAEKARKKAEIMKQLRSRLQEKGIGGNVTQKEEGSNGGGILNKLNPFQAGKSLRQTIGTLTSLGSGLNQETKQKYYLDDRFLENSGGVLSERNPYLERQEDSDHVPEVLVIGATGEIGRLVVRRLLLEGRFRVRVLVRDLYSQTLNLLGTGVTYCQGDLGSMESLEYALTDVDKIVFCATAPRPDEPDFQEKFQMFIKENLDETAEDIAKPEQITHDLEWQQLSSVRELRAQLAEQIDFVGMNNLVRAYQNVRHADYGTSQAAKRSVFKFSSRAEDFGLFSLDDDTVDFLASKMVEEQEQQEENLPISPDDDYGDEGNPYAEYDHEDYDEDDYVEDEEYYENIEARRDATVRSRIQWIRNEFGHGVFVGKVPKTNRQGVGGEAGIVSSRLRSRDDPENGIDLSGGFAGFIMRLVSDGSNYEAFVRTGDYDETGIEYVCQFSTGTKATSNERKSRNKFITARLPFENFKPVLRRQDEARTNPTVPPFRGSDVRRIGLRFRSASNPKQSRLQSGSDVSFYIALSYVKVYRLQPEPEFVYLSDARIPPVVKNGMVRHDQRRLLLHSKISADDHDVDQESLRILNDASVINGTSVEPSPEEIYYRFRGEEVLKSSGLSYSIIRVAGYNESPSGEASSIDLIKTNHALPPVSRADAAQVCVSALLDPEALNKSVYVGKRKGTVRDENMSTKFASLPKDST